MTKVACNIYIDLDDLSIFDEIKARYHLKNTSQALHILIRQWQTLMDDKQKTLRLVKDELKHQDKRINPQVLA
jgi:hypothetical protein